MPWKVTCPVSERLNFINDWLTSRGSVAGLCAAYGISRKTGYKWIARFRANGKSGLEDNNRACRSHPNATDGSMAALVIAARHAHPSWGPRKLRDWLVQRHPGQTLPASSTIGDILKRAGLVAPRRRGRRLHGGQGNVADYAGPNSVWCIDYKGQFRLGDGRMCYPLTITDGFSRMVPCCEAHPGPRDANARTTMEAVFKHYGPPNAIRSDNGPPFASIGAGPAASMPSQQQRFDH